MHHAPTPPGRRRVVPVKFGTLRIRFLDGTDRDYPLDLPAAVVGRGEGVSLVVDDFSISRRHASIAIDTGNLLIEDLGSATGTFLNGERLTPHVRYVVDPGDDLRIGDLEAVYYPPPPAEAATTAGNAEGLPGGLHVALVSPAVPIDPGKNVTATLAVTNRARIVDEIELTIPALPASWYTIVTPRFSLVPNAREEVQIVLHPPREHASLAGEYDFAVHVRSHEQGQEFIASGSFTLLPFESASVSLATIRTKRDFKVIAENSSNQPIALDLTGRDDDQAFQYQFAQPAVSLQPGEKTVVPLRVKRRRQLLGQPSQPFFEVIGKSRGTGSEVSARGQLAIHPPLEKFKMPVLFMLGAIILAFTAIAVLVITDNDGVQRAGAESEYAGVHLCDDPGSEPRTSPGGGTASDGPVRPDATIAGAGNNSGGTPIFGNADSQGGPFFAQNDPRWADVEYARSTELPGGKDWCGTTIAQCGCAMTSVGVMLALYQITELPDGSQLNPEALNAWFNGEARRTERGWVSRGYIYGDVIWAAANAISGEMAKRNPGTTTIRFVRKGTGTEDEIRGELNRGRPVILEVPGHWIAAVGIDAATGDILINDPFYRDRTTLNVYAGKVRSSVIFEPSNDLSAVVLTAPADVKFRVIDKQGRVVGAGDVPDADAVVQIPGASFDSRRAWRDPTCIEQAPPPGAGTNQIMLPGNADDYTIEILDTGGQPGSVAVHTYGRDGTASISTIDTAGAAVAELSVDPETGTTNVQVTTGGTPTPATTPTPGGGAGGVEETPTPTIEPTVGPPPTPTPTPFEAATTNITIGAEPGQTRVETASNAGFELGDPIRFAPGQPNEEDNIIVGFGSMLLATPLRFAHGPGEVIERLPRPPGQGPGLPPGITPPPSTGPLEPPSTVGLACSTIYQPSPKLATFICDLQVTGEYTITRWTLNGQIVPEFTGSNSFVMAFPEDTPASIAASVCNVTICRSVSRQETIDFGTGLGNQGTGTGGQSGPSGPSGPTIQPTPVPQGQVVVVCHTAFPISEDGQSAQFTCEANFSGDYTSISWSAPGGTPANKSGQDKTFETFIKNELGAPVSLSVTATVCNFGTCITSQPRVVGIGRTAVILDSAPVDQVHSGHRLTLMARVQGIGGITPQGGTVQFYVDPLFDTEKQQYILEPSAAFGPSAPLFTTGDVAVAQVSVDTSNLNFGNDPLNPGANHTFIGAYSGGTNAFGSMSADRTIRVLPPIPDGCDSVDEDNPPDGIVDNTCRNAVDPATGFSVPGGYAVPKNLGGGTVITAVNLSSPNALPGTTANTIVLRPNEPFTVSGNAGRTDYCPGCIRQVYIGIGSNSTANVPAQGPVCVANGGFPLVMNASGMPNPGAGISWSTGGLLKAPPKPGVYYVRATTTLDYFCVGPQVGPPENSIARVIVTDTVSTELDIWQSPGPGSTNLWTPAGSLTPASEISSSQQVILRARVNLEQTPSGRVLFTTPNSMLFQPGTSNPNIAADICPANGQLILLTAVIDCVPGEARAFAVAAAAASGLNLIVTARLQPEVLEVPHPINATGTEDYTIRSAVTPVPANNTAGLTVLVPSTTGLTVSPTGNVAICFEVTSAGCQPITLTASVGATPPSSASANGGRVQFYYRPNGGSADSWVPIGAEQTVANGEAAITVHPGFGTDTLDAFQFQARFSRGTTNLEPSSSAASATVTFVRAMPTVVVNNNLSPANPIVGQSISISATVTGANGYSPSGTVQFRVRPAGGSAGTEADLGAPVALVETGGAWIATLPATATGEDNTVLENAGSFEIRAVFAQTPVLSSVTSAAFPFTLGLEPPGITVTLPDTDSATAGNQVTVGENQNIQVQLSGSRTNRLNNQGSNSSGLSVTILNNGTSIGTASINEQGAASFSVAGLNAGPYSITVSYPGNLFYGAITSSPAQTLTVTQFTPVVTLNAITPVAVGSNLTNVTATVTGSGLGSPAGGSISFYVGSVASGNLLITDTTLTGPTSESTYTASVTIPTGGSNLLANADTAYTIIAQYDGNAGGNTTNSNVGVSSGSSSGTHTGSVTLTKRTPTVTIANQTATLGQNTSFTATIASGSTGVTPDCTECVQFKYGPIGTTVTNATNIGAKESVGGGIATLANVPTGTGTPFPSNGQYVIWAVYDGNDNVAAGDGSGNLTIAIPVDVTVSAAVSAGTVGTAITLTGTVSPVGAPGTILFRANGTNIGSAQPVSTTTGTATTTWTPATTGSYTITAVYTSNSSNYLSDPVSNNLSIPVGVATSVSVTGNTTGTIGSSETFSISVTPNTASGTVALFAAGVQVASGSLSGGSASLSWTPNTTGNVVMTATYTSNNLAAFASAPTSNNHTINIQGIQVTVTVSAATTGTVGVAQTLTANVSPSAAPGTVQFRVNAVNFGAPVNLASGTATIQWTPANGDHFEVTATYTSSSTTYQSATTSNTATIVVPIPTTLTATASQTGPAGSSVTLSASISPASGGTQALDHGTVQFIVNGVNHGSPVTVTNGAATLSATLAPETYQITATYSGGTSGSQTWAPSADTTNFQIVVN